jgi:hypothetical protein
MNIEGNVFITNKLTEEQIEKGCDALVINRFAFYNQPDEIFNWRDKYGFKLIIDIDDYWNLSAGHILAYDWEVNNVWKFSKLIIGDYEAGAGQGLLTSCRTVGAVVNGEDRQVLRRKVGCRGKHARVHEQTAVAVDHDHLFPFILLKEIRRVLNDSKHLPFFFRIIYLLI